MIDNNIEKINVAVLGATGVVGQVFIHLLADHPWFRPAVVCGSDSRQGKLYGKSVRWNLPVPLPEYAQELVLQKHDTHELRKNNIKIVFSALPADVAKEVEPGLRENGFHVFSNAGALRYEADVPILIPEVNPDSLSLIEEQGYPQKGFVVTNANCSTTGLAAALGPLTPLGLKEVFVSTYQSVSGAGYPGLPAMDILGNSVPHIPKEEEKMITELQKILQLDIAVYPHCVRVPVLYGHQETVWLTFNDEVKKESVLEAWRHFRCVPGLPTLPESPVVYCEAQDQPQPGMSFWGNPPGMQVFVGRLREVGGRIGFTLVVNNLVKGAAGGSIANAELFVRRYLG
ncbi:MAG: aspartate-semialdehyde dehydrogenase [bacterium]|nr:aspartate-semialdehyde dehydrogenase [bacterium]